MVQTAAATTLKKKEKEKEGSSISLQLRGQQQHTEQQCSVEPRTKPVSSASFMESDPILTEGLHRIKPLTETTGPCSSPQHLQHHRKSLKGTSCHFFLACGISDNIVHEQYYSGPSQPARHFVRKSS